MSERRVSAATWYGVLAGPLAWSVQLVVGWGGEEVIACAPAATDPGTILGTSLATWLVALTAVLLGATMLAGLLSMRELRTSGAMTSVGGWQHWMARVGVLNSVLFGVVIAIGFVPAFTLDPCGAS